MRGSSGGAANKVAGVLTDRPSMASFGDTPVVLCIVILYALITTASFCGYVSGSSYTVALSIAKIVLFMRSVCPSDRV